MYLNYLRNVDCLCTQPTPTPLRPMPNDLTSIINEETVMPELEELGTYENSPVELTDVVRESDSTPEYFLPSEGVTRQRQSQYHNIASKQTGSYVPSGISLKV